MKVIVCGGRDYTDAEFVFAALDYAHRRRGITLVVHGAARGADYLAGCWAKQRGIPAQEFPAEWKVYGNRAGMIRNRLMIEAGADAVIAFPGGTGTGHTVNLAVAASIPVWQPAKTAVHRPCHVCQLPRLLLSHVSNETP